MKKSLFLRCLLLVFTFHCSTSLAKTGHSSKGKTPEQQHTAIIKSLEISEYQLKFGIQEEFGRVVESYQYDSTKKLVESRAYFQNGAIRSKTRFYHDSIGNIISTFTYSTYCDSVDSSSIFIKDSVNFFQSVLSTGKESETIFPAQKNGKDLLTNSKLNETPIGSIVTKTEYFYDDRSLLIEKVRHRYVYDSINVISLFVTDTTIILDENEEQIFPTDSIGFDLSYDYDTLGNIVKASLYQNGKRFSYFTNKHDKLNRKVELVEFNDDGAIIQKKGFRYNPKEQKNEEVLYDDNGNVVSKTIIKFDKKNNIIDLSTFDTTRYLISETKRVFDKNGYINEESFFSKNGKLDGKFSYKYDSSGNIFEKYWYVEKSDKPTTFRRYIYDYDQKK